MSKVSSTIGEAEAQQILDQHNCARRRHNVAPLKWDWSLAAAAQEHADRCVWQHASEIGKGVRGQGENMSMTTGMPVNVQGWIDEERYYDCVNGKCRKQPCGHWTQMCWNSTERVGCGKRRCASIKDQPRFPNAELLVCRYSPPGNYVGRRMMSAENCALGAVNRSCAGKISTAAEIDPQPVQEFVEAEQARDVVRDIQQPENTPANNLYRVGANMDQFAAERQRIAQLSEQQKAALTAASGGDDRLIVFTTRDGRKLTRPVRSIIGGTTPPKRPSPIDNDESEQTKGAAAPYTRSDAEIAVFADPNSAGYEPAEQRVESEINFAWQIVVVLAALLLLVLAFMAYLFYRYRKPINKKLLQARDALLNAV